jgi:hypothetical protein
MERDELVGEEIVAVVHEALNRRNVTIDLPDVEPSDPA